jgi:hypothetical protein
MCGVVWLFVQQFDDFETGSNFVAQHSGCAIVWTVYGHVCELLYHVITSSLILIPFAYSFQNVTYNCIWRILAGIYTVISVATGIMGSEDFMCIKTAILNQYLSKYSFSSSGIRSLPPSHKLEQLPTQAALDTFSLWHLAKTEVCANLSYRVWTQSLVVQLLYNTLLGKFVWPCMGPFTASFDGQDTSYTRVFIWSSLIHFFIVSTMYLIHCVSYQNHWYRSGLSCCWTFKTTVKTVWPPNTSVYTTKYL